jgi:hypothetical protein
VDLSGTPRDEVESLGQQADLVRMFETAFEGSKEMVAMVRCRAGHAPGCLDPLAAERVALPHREAFLAERDQLALALADARVPIQARVACHRQLDRLLAVDAYHAAFGAVAPYGAERVLQALFPVGYREARRVPEAEVPIDHGADPGPGEHLLWRWPSDADRMFPWIFSPEGDAHPQEMAGFDHARRISGGEWKLGNHLGIEVSLQLGPDPAARYARARLRLAVGNLDTPQTLRLLADEALVTFHPSPARSARATGSYRQNAHPEEIVEFVLPGAALRPGTNTWLLGLRPLPGVRRFAGVDVDELVLVLEPRE